MLQNNLTLQRENQTKFPITHFTINHYIKTSRSISITPTSWNLFYQKNGRAKPAHLPTSWHFLLKSLYPVHTIKFSGHFPIVPNLHKSPTHFIASSCSHWSVHYFWRTMQLKSSSEFIRTSCRQVKSSSEFIRTNCMQVKWSSEFIRTLCMKVEWSSEFIRTPYMQLKWSSEFIRTPCMKVKYSS
jgi:hypothetical protein